MTGDEPTPERAAADWFLRLREEPEDECLRSHFDAWIAADPRHRDVWHDMQQTVQLIGQAPPDRRSYILPRTTLPHHRVTWKIAALSATAACVLLLILPVLTLWLRADHFTLSGQVQTVQLQDGSTIQLGPDSAIAIDELPDTRNIRLLSGQALFEVTHDPARPFRVVAGEVTTTVLGTGFEVRRIGSRTHVAVRHGRVRVDDVGAAPISRELTAGEWVRVERNAPMANGTQAPDAVGLWYTGNVSVRNQSIQNLIDEIRPWYGGKIVLASSELAAQRVTGTYDFHDPARSLSLIVAPYHGRVTRITPWLMVVTAD